MDARPPEPGQSPFWLGDALSVGPSGLALDGASLAEVARQHGTPVYVYSAATVRRRVAELRAALRAAGMPYRIYYAMKANRFAPFLAVIRAEGDVGIDACSPREIARAAQAGFAPGEISVTAGMLSNRDIQAFAGSGAHVNLDARSALRRWAAQIEGARRVGLRIDPAIQAGWGDDPGLSYSNSKFGVDLEAVEAVAAYAVSLGLEIDTLHLHAGWGLQASAAPAFAGALAQLAALARAIPTVRTLNVGGGLGPAHRQADEPLSLSTWSALLREHLAPTGCALACEPGTFLAATAGVLLVEVTTREVRRSGTWLGVDAGHNVNGYMAHYQIPHAIVPVARPLDAPTEVVHLAGNINEAKDIFARSLPLPRLEEGDLLALHPAGAYGASMASDHCLRDLPAEVML